VLQVPRPHDASQLEPQLRDYVEEKVAWVLQNPRDPTRQAALGIVYAANALWREARSAFANVARLNPNEPLALLYVAIATQELGELDKATELFRQCTTQFPDFPQGFWRLGDALLRQGAFDEAEPAFRRLTQLAPREWRGYAGLAEIQIRRGEYVEAVKNLERALQLDPHAPAAHALLGTAYRALSRLEEAEIELSRGLDKTAYPMPDAWADRAHEHMLLIQDQIEIANNYCERGLPAKAIELLTKALSFEPSNLSLLNNLAISYQRAGQPDRARPILLKSLQLDPRNVPAHIALSLGCHAAGQYDEALAWADKAAALATNSPQPYLARANALLAQGKDTEAVESLNQAFSRDPKNPEIQIELGDIYLQNLDQPDEALRHYQLAAQLNPTFPSAFVRLARLYTERGATNEARSAISRLRMLEPAHPAIPLLEAPPQNRKSHPEE
jgi:tetratricopeptide (TPR) repeat protein